MKYLFRICSPNIHTSTKRWFPFNVLCLLFTTVPGLHAGEGSARPRVDTEVDSEAEVFDPRRKQDPQCHPLHLAHWGEVHRRTGQGEWLQKPHSL